MVVKSYRELHVWHRALDLVDAVYDVSTGYPKDEKYGLVSQIQRAAVSVPSNIAEGCASGYTRYFLRHIAIAKGSLAEVETQLEISLRRKFIDSDQHQKLLAMAGEIGRMLSRLGQALERRLNRLAPKS